jgi:two-component system sensor histidine kinase RegB
MNTNIVNLRRLTALRLIAIAVLATCAFFWHNQLNNTLPLIPIAFILGGWSLISFWGLTLKPHRHLLSVQLISDIIWLTTLLYFTGGATNPFVSFYLVPLAIAAASLPSTQAWLISAFTLICYSPLLFVFEPLAGMEATDHSMHTQHNEGTDSGFSWHILGMWFNYVLSALCISFFLIKMKQMLDKQDAALQKNKEKALQDAQLLAIATQAAGTAHELSTPLSSMAVIVDDLKDSAPEETDMLTLLEHQINVCKEALQTLVSNSHQQQVATAQTFLEQTIEHWLLLHPQKNILVHWPTQPTNHILHYHPNLQQALINLLNNAAEASKTDAELSLSWNEKSLTWKLQDFGKGIDPTIHSLLGKQPVDSEKGLGIGLYLSRASIEQQGGNLSWQSTNNGTLTTAVIPLRTSSAYQSTALSSENLQGALPQ